MFHVASAASKRPALRPTRGSGFGAEAALLGLTPVVAFVDTERAHAVTAMTLTTLNMSLDEAVVTDHSPRW
jgi:hypothetical protein